MSIAPADLGGPYTTVFDVGAFRGDFARACMAAWPKCTVHSFEPLEEGPAEVGPEGHCCWWWYQVALGNRVDVIAMNRNVFVPSSSVLPMAELHETAFPYTKGSEEVAVGMAKLDEFADLIVVPALLKIDVQGYELEVLWGAGDSLDLFAAVVLEVSHEELYHGAADPTDLAKYLNAAGFQHERRVDALYHPQDRRRLLQSDELWVRP